MKNILFVILVLIVFTGNSFAQSSESSEEPQGKSKIFGECERALNITLGYIPKSTINALKTSFAFNNILFKRVGVYTTFEKSLDSDLFSNMYGLTFSVHKRVYLYGGVDLFTKYGYFNKDNTGVRKEIGIGFIPYKSLVVTTSWSKSAGIAFTAGIKIPL